MMGKPRLLIIEEDGVIRTQLRWALSDEYDVAVAEDRDSAIALLSSSRPHVVTLQLGLLSAPSVSAEGLRLLAEILDLEPLARVIVVAGNGDQSSAVKAVDMGAFDYCLKPIDMDELRAIVRRAVRLRTTDDRMFTDNPALRGLSGKEGFPQMQGSSQQMLSVFSTIDRAARSDVNVLITGESGTGKEMAARAIHVKSGRRGAAFLPINCAAIPETLRESELFSHASGKFSGAHPQRKGRLEFADGGTVFLEEISGLSPTLQVNLLRFLQEREVGRAGKREGTPPDIRIITASNTDLSKAIANGSFRKGLYYMLAVVVVTIPPLREREKDSLLLARYFLDRMSQEMDAQPRQFDPSAEEAIRSHAWPGNVRELQNKVKRAIIMARGRVITPSDLDLPSVSEGRHVVSLRQARNEVERQTIIAALRRNRGNISRAASEIGVSRPTLHALLHKHNVQPVEFHQG